jgi:hypothetical protein
MLKLLQEMKGFAEIAKRRPTPRLPGLVLMQMRSHVVQAALPKRRLSVQKGVPDHSDIPHPVKINYSKQNPAQGITLPAS